MTYHELLEIFVKKSREIKDMEPNSLQWINACNELREIKEKITEIERDVDRYVGNYEQPSSINK